MIHTLRGTIIICATIHTGSFDGNSKIISYCRQFNSGRYIDLGKLQSFIAVI
jgi:hypothetical protein